MCSTRKPLSPELVEQARVELNEIQSEVPSEIQKLREKILENSTFNFRTDDHFLLRFLRARKFDQKRTLELIINYYRQRELYPHMFRKWPTSGLEAALSCNIYGVLPSRDSHGRTIAIYNVENWIPSEVSVDDLVIQSLWSGERMLQEDEFQIKGGVIVFNMRGFTIKHFIQYTPMAIKRAASILLNNFPVRIKAIHVLNEPFIVNALFLIIKSFLSKKLTSRFTFHGHSLDKFHQAISPQILPQELGGHLGPYDNTEWNRVLIAHEEAWKNDLSYGFLKKN